MKKNSKTNLTLLKIKSRKLLTVNDQFKTEIPAITEYVKKLAAIRKINYDAHIDEGFTPEQALELCKSTTI